MAASASWVHDIWPRADQGKTRLDGLDLARGCAIALMVLSHTVKGLLSFKMMPAYAIVPIHAITKFSSSLFVFVFGVTLAVVYLPKVGTADWPSVTWRLWRRGLWIMICYKALIVVQMFQLSSQLTILDTLLWRRFPDFVEILQFYAWFVLLLPFILPLWKALPLLDKVMLTAGFAVSSHLLRLHFDFWGIWQLKAILVEQEGTFCFGVLSRGAMALFGLLLGQFLVGSRDLWRQACFLGAFSILIGGAMLAAFAMLHSNDLHAVLRRLAHNYGKHPPNLTFLLYSGGGALVLLGIFLPMRGPLVVLLKPLQIIGRESLFAFNFHIVFVWVIYRYLLDLRHRVTYDQALLLTGLVFSCAVFGAMLNRWRKRGAMRDANAHLDDESMEGRGSPDMSEEEAQIAAEFDGRGGGMRVLAGETSAR